MNIPTYVINLKNRVDKKRIVQSHLKRYKIKFRFYHPELNSNPKQGCKISHLHLIEEGINKGYDKILILEDDVKFIKDINIKNYPEKWDMLYLGGTVFRVLNKDNKDWYRVQCWTTHAYIINLRNKELINKIRECVNNDDEIDKYYLTEIHPNFQCYMINPMIAIQREGYSDIEGRYVNYDFMIKTLNGLEIPEYEIDNDQNYILKLPEINEEDLPNVSIITPTYKRRDLFYMAIRNFLNFNYPKDKLEWIIIDDTPESYDNIEDILPNNDKRIKYIKIKSNRRMNISEKRNIGVENSNYDIIIHMDDDDYYPPESILCRVKLLIKYRNKNIECLGSTLIGTYNLLDNTSSMSSDSPISLSEASMAYTKNFWKECKFDESVERGEHKIFTENRLNKILDVPYIFILIAITHGKNITKSLRYNDKNGLLKYKMDNKIANYYDMFDIETQVFINDLRINIIKKNNK